MKAILEFNLPEDNEDYKIVQNALGYYLTLVDLKDKLRQTIKYGNMSEAESAPYEQVRDWLYEFCQRHNVEL